MFNKNKKFKNFNAGEMPFGLQIIIFLLIIFVIWVLAGGAKKEEVPSPLIKPTYEGIIPG